MYAVVSTAEGAGRAHAAWPLLPHARIGRRVQRRVKAPCKTSSMPIVFAGAAESPFPRWTGYRQEAIDRGRGRVSPILYLYIDALPFAVARRLLPPMSRGEVARKEGDRNKGAGPRSIFLPVPALVNRRGGCLSRCAESTGDDGLAYLAGALAAAGAAPSATEARRLIDAGAVRVEGERVPAGSYRMPPSALDGARVQVGRRRFLRLAASPRP